MVNLLRLKAVFDFFLSIADSKICFVVHIDAHDSKLF